MFQKIFAGLIVVFGILIIQRTNSLFGLILIFAGYCMYCDAQKGVWFYIDFKSKDRTGYQGDNDSEGGRD